MGKAVFLDRDGTINEDVGYLFDKKDLEFIPGSIKALKILQKHYRLLIVTNQPGIGEKIFTAGQYRAFNEYFQSVLKKEGVNILDTYCCPHRKVERCACYKPGTFFMEKAREKHRIDPANSYVIGDHPHDVEMGRRMGARTIYLLTGHGIRHKDELAANPDKICSDLYEAAMWITGKDDDETGKGGTDGSPGAG